MGMYRPVNSNTAVDALKTTHKDFKNQWRFGKNFEYFKAKLELVDLQRMMAAKMSHTYNTYEFNQNTNYF